jgi:hypothetical protein
MPHKDDRCWEQIVIETLSNELRKVNDLLDFKLEEAAECKLRLCMMKGILTDKNRKIKELQATIQHLRGEEEIEDEQSCCATFLVQIDDLVDEDEDEDDDSLESTTIDSLDLTKERSSRTLQIPPTLVLFSEYELKSGQGVSTTPLPGNSRPVSKVPKAA